MKEIKGSVAGVLKENESKDLLNCDLSNANGTVKIHIVLVAMSSLFFPMKHLV